MKDNISSKKMRLKNQTREFRYKNIIDKNQNNKH